MRINFVLPLLMRTPVGGYRVVFEYADGLARLGHDVTIVYPRRWRPDALAALRDFHAIHPEVPVTMFGTPVRGPEVPDWIVYRRDPPQAELVDDIYNGHSVYLGASLQEGWGLPPMEAMACGCTFVGTDIGGFREFAVDGETAFLGPPGDVAAMTRHLVRLTRDPALRLDMQVAAERHVRRFTWDRACSSLLDRIISCAEGSVVLDSGEHGRRPGSGRAMRSRSR